VTEVAVDAAAARLGARVRDLRHARGLTLVQLAEACELSHPFLSQCERGRASFSLASLRRIAVALGTSPVELVAAAEGAGSAPVPALEVRRRGEPGGSVADFAVGDARALASGERPFVPLEYRAANASPGDTYVHAEDEFVYVLQGEVSVEVAGSVMVLAPGDSAYYQGSQPHRWWSEGGPYRLLVVKQSPSFPRV
jgi:transcriptional regulator with XRE-family HTH domain